MAAIIYIVVIIFCVGVWYEHTIKWPRLFRTDTAEFVLDSIYYRPTFLCCLQLVTGLV